MNAPTRNEWLESRKQGIGASDIAAVLGISPFKTPLELFLDKRGELPPQEDKAVFRRGRLLEPVVLQFYEDETGRKVSRQQEVVVGVESFMRCTLDGFDEQVIAPVEAKTVSPFAAKEFGEHGTDEIPLYYAAQVHWQMMLTNAGTGYLAALIGSDDFRVFELKRDLDLEQLLQVRAREFWKRVQDGTPPEPVSEEDVKLLYPKDAGSQIEASIEIAGKVQQLAVTKQQLKDLEEDTEKMLASIKSFMGHHSVLIGLDGKPLVTWKNAKASEKIDWEAIAKYCMGHMTVPNEIIAAHTKTINGSRRFLIK